MPSTFAKPVNNFSTTLASTHALNATTLALQPGDGARLGTLAANRVYRVTAVVAPETPSEVIIAIYEATGIAVDVLTGVTGAEGYANVALSSGTPIEVRITAKHLSDLQDSLNVAETSIASLTTLGLTTVYTTGSYPDPAWITGLAGAKVSGNITGNSGSITGSIVESQVTNLVTDLAAKAPIASPTFTGVPVGPTAVVSTNTTQLATTAFVLANQSVTSVAGRGGAVVIAESDVTNLVTDLAAKAALASPVLTGVPAAPTAAPATNTTQVATTAFVLANQGPGVVTSVAGRTGAVVLAEADVTNLVADLAAKSPLASPALTGVPTAPTAALATNTTQIATTAFVIANATGSAGVSSVGLALPPIFTVSGSPVTASGVLTGTLATQAANLVFSGPGSAGPSAPTFRALVAADIPSLSATYLVKANNFSDVASVVTARSNLGLGGLAVLSSVDLSTLVTNTLQAAQFPALTGDVTTTAGSLATAIGAGKVTNSQLAGSIASAKLVGTDIATVGTVTSGTWSATTIAIAKGGTGQITASSGFDALSPNTTLGDVDYRGASGNVRLAGNTTAAKQYLSQTGTGTVSAAPAWATLAESDVTNLVTDLAARASSISLITPNTIYATPINFTNTAGAFSGTLALNTQAANTVLSGPSSGGSVVPTFRALVAADIPAIAESGVTNLVADLALKAPLANPQFTGTASHGGPPIANTLMTFTGDATNNGLAICGVAAQGGGGSDNTAGVSIRLAFNSPGNRQIFIGDSTHISSATSPSFRIIFLTNQAILDAISGDASTGLDMFFGATNTNTGFGITVGAVIPSTLKNLFQCSAAKVGIAVMAAASQTGDLQQWQNVSNTPLAAITANGAFRPAHLSNANAENDTMYYSTDASKLVYKDSGGVVNNLY